MNYKGKQNRTQKTNKCHIGNAEDMGMRQASEWTWVQEKTLAKKIIQLNHSILENISTI